MAVKLPFLDQLKQSWASATKQPKPEQSGFSSSVSGVPSMPPLIPRFDAGQGEDVLGAQAKVNDLLSARARGEGLESPAVEPDRRDALRDSISSFMASRSGPYDVNMARQAERRMSEIPINGIESQRIAEQGEMTAAGGLKQTLENRFRSANQDYQDYLQRYEQAVNTFKTALSDRVQRLSLEYGEDIAKQRAYQELHEMKVIEDLVSMHQELKRKAQNRADVYTGILTAIQGATGAVNTAASLGRGA